MSLSSESLAKGKLGCGQVKQPYLVFADHTAAPTSILVKYFVVWLQTSNKTYMNNKAYYKPTLLQRRRFKIYLHVYLRVTMSVQSHTDQC